MADSVSFGSLGSDVTKFTVKPLTVTPPPPEINWLLILATLLAGAGATYAGTA